jgi:solute carrier family 38 (sodium-coupled neutral amino acid transporter), member 11
MPIDDSHANAKSEEPITGSEEGRSLLSHGSTDHEDEADGSVDSNNLSLPVSTSERPRHAKRQSSLSYPPPDGQPRAPRTPNRVRFDLEDIPSSPETTRANEHPPESPLWIEEEDYLHSNGDARQHAPLLTGITPPSDSPFLSESFQPEEHLPNARPKSGMRSAFMNMANSIIGAGIIGQPYAFRQAGLTMGIILLVALTVTVDWTIRLIVINSKLSGADSFQATMQHCFGQSGLVAISVAQWAFAFGGMVAFCVIVGDTIPHVLVAVIPGLRDMSFLWLLTDRRFVIVLFVLGVSWPLSLYRDIAKVGSVNHFCQDIDADQLAQLSKASTLALISMCVIIITVITQGVRVPAESRGDFKGLLFVSNGFFQAVGVVSFGELRIIETPLHSF